MSWTLISPQRVIRHSRLTEPQRRWLGSTAAMKAFVGGVGSGKTRAGCLEVLRQPPGSVGMVLAPTYPMLRDATLRSLMDLCEAAGIIRSFNRSEMRLELAGRRTILLRSADQPDRLRGPNLGWYWLDEAAMMDKHVWLIMLGRLRLAPARAWVTSTPRGKNWLFDEFAGGIPGRYLVQASSRSNAYLPTGFVDTLVSSYDESFAKQEVDGSFLDDPSGKLIWPDWLDAAAIRRPEADPRKHSMSAEGNRRISCDPSEGRGADKSVVIVRDEIGILHVEADSNLGPAGCAARINDLKVEWQVSPSYISIDGGGGAGRELALGLAKYRISPRQYFGGGKGGPRFFNLRAASAWRLREVCQAGIFGLARAGSHLPAMRAELAALSIHKVLDKDALILKEDLHKILGHSPDYADALLQSFSYE